MTANPKFGLYPEITPYRTGRLKVSNIHEIYFEECGNPAGKPALVVHGGPGGGCNPTMRRCHDPDVYRIILFDQRGCGRSTPHACLEQNTTWDLVADMEQLRDHLDIAQWQLFGGSWGSALSLAYGERHTEKLSELILRGIFTLRRRELEWFYQEGCSWIYPDAFEAYAAIIPEAERGDMIAAYHKRLTDEDPAVQRQAANAWSVWEGTTLSLLHDPERVEAFGKEDYALAFARIECHYFINGGFFESDDQLIANAYKLRDVPGIIVQGRYDVVTPLRTAWDLKSAWPDAELRIVPDAGHAMSEPGIVHELIAGTRKFGAAPAD
ncbi:proline iminopeptidase [bacterium MnTg02]|nr:proline iminopeptidase [bacterium MnTg02]